MSSVEKIARKANIPFDADLITVATDTKNVSGKRFANMIMGIFLFGIGIYAFLTILYGISYLITSPFHIVGTLGTLLLLALMILLGMFCFYGAFDSFSPKSDWFLALYNDRLLYKYKEDDLFLENEIPITDIQRCIILHKFKKGFRVRGKDTSEYHLSVHFEYERNDEKQFISVYKMDGYEEMNQILTYIIQTKNIPFYYAELYQDITEELDDIEGLQEAEEATFSGDLKTYQKRLGIHYI